MAHPVEPVPVYSGLYEVVEPPLEDSIWGKLEAAIERYIQTNGYDKRRLKPGEPEEFFLIDAVEQIYYDVSEFYYWYWVPEDPRHIAMAAAINKTSPALKKVVGPVVASNLDAMEEADELPAGLDENTLLSTVTNNLVNYIAGWEDWYWDRREEEAAENYYELASMDEDIYYESDYGDATNLTNSEDFDGYSDVPFVSEED